MVKLLLLAAAAALVLVFAAKKIAAKMLRDDHYGGVSAQLLSAQREKTEELVRLSVKKQFSKNLKNIEILEIGAFGANILNAALEKPEETPAQPQDEQVEAVTVEPGDDVVLSLRWRNTGKKTLRQAMFAVAFLSPDGEVLCPDALETDPWMAQFGVAALASFSGNFPTGTGKRQKDLKNAFLLYHGPVGGAVILGVKLICEDGTVFEQTVTE
jgi:hypothetical protein